MALTLTRVRGTIFGGERVSVYDVDFDSSYPTGGESLTAADLGLRSIELVLASPKSGYVFEYDYANSKILARLAGGFTPAGTISKPAFVVEAAGAIGTTMEVGLSADSAAATFEGGVGITAQRTLTTTSPVGVPTFTGTAVAAAVLPEVGDTTNLSALTGVRVFAIGN